MLRKDFIQRLIGKALTTGKPTIVGPERDTYSSNSRLNAGQLIAAPVHSNVPCLSPMNRIHAIVIVFLALR